MRCICRALRFKILSFTNSAQVNKLPCVANLRYNMREGKSEHSEQSDAGACTGQMDARYVNAPKRQFTF